MPLPKLLGKFLLAAEHLRASCRAGIIGRCADAFAVSRSNLNPACRRVRYCAAPPGPLAPATPSHFERRARATLISISSPSLI